MSAPTAGASSERMLWITCSVIPLAERDTVRATCHALGVTRHRLLRVVAAARVDQDEKGPYVFMATRKGDLLQVCHIRGIASDDEADRVIAVLQKVADQLGDSHLIRAALVADGFLDPVAPPVSQQ